MLPRQLMVQRKAIVEESITCPISGEVMKDPVLAADGYTYDRASISKWLATNSKSPVHLLVPIPSLQCPLLRLHGIGVECWSQMTL